MKFKVSLGMGWDQTIEFIIEILYYYLNDIHLSEKLHVA